MTVTISTHNGSNVAHEHNIRNLKVVSKEKHIDIQGIHETWIDEPIRQAYKRLFEQSVPKHTMKNKLKLKERLMTITILSAKTRKNTPYMK